MPSTTNATLIEPVRETAHRLTGATGEYDPPMDLIGDARFVLLGEASHGTHEFYHERALITRRLIEEKGFTAVAVEADWPDAYRVNRYVRGASDDVYGIEALADFRRFPAWMWRNTDVVTTDHGTVTAASDWGGPAERKRVRSALPDSYEATFHETRLARFLLTGRDVERVSGAVHDLRLERAIGVIYRPETERASHYFYAWLPEQFDAVLHFDETRAVEPLERTSEWDMGEPPETFPSGV